MASDNQKPSTSRGGTTPIRVPTSTRPFDDRKKTTGPVTRKMKRKCQTDNASAKARCLGLQNSTQREGQGKPAVLTGSGRRNFSKQKKTDAASGLTRTVHGNVYQIKHLMLILNRARKNGYPFRLFTEMKAAEKFDDLVLEYKDSTEKKVHRFVQVKHKQDETESIRASHLLDIKDGAFSVLKYFISWRTIKKYRDFGKSSLRNFILCTNIDLDVKGLKKVNIGVIEVTESDEFLKIIDRHEQPPRYNLLVDEALRREHPLYDALRLASDVHRLARELAERVFEQKCKLYFNTDIMKRYHAALVQEVIDMTNKKFFSNFVRNDSSLSAKAKNFREIFFLHAKQLPSNKNVLEKEIRKCLEERVLKLSSPFGKTMKLTTKPELNRFAELPDDRVTDGEISHFLKEFILAVKQPNEVELGKMISCEIGADSQFNLLDADIIGDYFQSKMLDWFKKTEEHQKFLVNKDAEDFFNEMEVKLSSLITMGLSLEYTEVLQKYDVNFKSGNTDLQNFLHSSDFIRAPILELISSKHTLLTALRAHQTLATMEEFRKNDSFIFIRLVTLVLPKILDRVLRAFEWPDNHNLLVIDCGSISAKEFTQKLWNPVCDVMEMNRDKRMILIIQGNHDSTVQFKISCETSYEKDDDVSVDNLTDDSRQKLIDKKVIRFQGQAKRTSFRRLLGRRHNLGRIIDSNTLLQLIQDEEIQIGRQLKGLDEIQHYYIPRTIVRHVVMKKNILNALGVSNLFAISGINRTAFEKLLANEEGTGSFDGNNQTKPDTNDAHVILEKGRETDHFKELCRRNLNHNIHWLEGGSGKLIWKQSHGDITSLMIYQDETRTDNSDRQDATYLTEDQLVDPDEQRRVVILSDMAGMGKSTVLTHLAGKMKENKPGLLVIRVDLTRHTRALAAEKNSPSFDQENSNGAVDFLVDKLALLDTDLESQVFKTIIKGRGEAALLFDGFDEISPVYEDRVIELLQALATLDVKKLFVTTRPHTNKLLEKKLGIFCHKLQVFSSVNQIDFLTKFWRRRLSANDVNERTEELLKRHAQRVMNILAKSINNQMKEFTGIPLQSRLVAEVFNYNKTVKRKRAEASMEVEHLEADEPKLPEPIDIIDLYSRFVDEKHRIYRMEKRCGDDSNPVQQEESELTCRIFLKMHQKFALDALFDEETARALLLSQPEVEGCIVFCRGLDDGGTRTGIVSEVIEGKPYFIHRSFAEYFAATFVINTLKDDSRNQNVREFFLAQLFVQPEHKTTRAFVNRLLSGETNSAKNGSWKIDLRGNRNADGGVVYHVAAEEGNLEIIRFFLNRLSNHHDEPTRRNVTETHNQMEHGSSHDTKLHEQGIDVNLKDRFHQTPLATALNKAYNIDVVKCFVEGGADINCEDWISATPLHIAARYPENLHVVEYLIGNGANINSKDKYGYTPLCNASAHSNLKAVKYLIEKGANINSPREGGRTPLHAAASRAKNLEVVKYLIEKGASTYSREKDGRTPLHVAAFEDDNLEVVRYLIEKHADVNSQAKDGWTPLHAAATEPKNLNVVRYLVENGAEVNVHEEDGWTPLQIAAAEDHNLEVVKYLIEKGADINSQAKDGRTPLHRAVNASNWHIVQFLLENGADPNIEDNSGKTPESIAILTNNYSDMVQGLFKKFANVKV